MQQQNPCAGARYLQQLDPVPSRDLPKLSWELPWKAVMTSYDWHND
jgi:hypothetical protein